MNLTLDEIMYIVDGIDPLYQFRGWGLKRTEPFGQGGLGYKPTPYNMVGGMAKMSVTPETKGQVTTETDDLNEIPLLDYVEQHKDDASEYAITRLINEMKDLEFLYDYAKEKEDEKMIDKIEEKKYYNDPISEYELSGEKYLSKPSYKKELKEIEKNIEKVNDSIIEKISSNPMIDETVYDEYQRQFTNLLLRDIIKPTKRSTNKAKNEFYEKMFDEAKQHIDELIMNGKIDYTKDKDKYTRGNLTESNITKYPTLTDTLTPIEGDLYNSKDENAYDMNTLNNLSRAIFNDDYNAISDDDKNLIKQTLFEWFPIDIIKKTNINKGEIYEIKSMTGTKYRDTKFKSSEIKLDPNGDRIIYSRFVYNVKDASGNIVQKYFNDISNDDKIINIDNIKLVYVERNKPPIKIGNILPEKSKGYDYKIIDNREQGVMYTNPLDKINFNKIRYQINQGKREVELGKNKNFLFPPSYVRAYNESIDKDKIDEEKRNDPRISDKSDKDISKMIFRQKKHLNLNR